MHRTFEINTEWRDSLTKTVGTMLCFNTSGDKWMSHSLYKLTVHFVRTPQGDKSTVEHIYQWNDKIFISIQYQQMRGYKDRVLFRNALVCQLYWV